MGTDEPSEQPRRCTLLERYAAVSAPTAGLIAGSTWGAAVIFLILYAHRMFLGDIGFVLTECLLLGAGCLGIPAFGVRMFASRHASAPTFMSIALVLAVVTGLLVILIGTGQLATSKIVTAFVVIMPESACINAANIALTLTRRTRALAEAEARHQAELEAKAAEHQRDNQAAYIAGIAASHEYERDLSHHVQALLSGPTDGLERAYEALGGELLARTGGHKKPNGHPVSPSSPAKLHLVDQRRELPPTGSSDQ